MFSENRALHAVRQQHFLAPDRLQLTVQLGLACRITNARIQTHDIEYILLFHSSDVYANAPQSYRIHRSTLLIQSTGGGTLPAMDLWLSGYFFPEVKPLTLPSLALRLITMPGGFTPFPHKTSWCACLSSKSVKCFVEKLRMTSASGKCKKNCHPSYGTHKGTR